MHGLEHSSAPIRPPTSTSPPIPVICPVPAPRVLLVEDDAEYGRVVERALRRGTPSLWVHREDRLDAALGRLERERFDAMIVDLSLPDGTGRATLGCACAIADHLPVLVLTGNDDEALARDATRAGAQDYLVKQRTHALTLSGAVLRAIERHRRGRKLQSSMLATSRALLATHGAQGVRVNEVLLLDRLDRAIARARRRGEAVAVFVAGYDDLDLLDEVLDPGTVSSLLDRATLRIARSIRRSDTLAALESRRFAIVVEGCGNPLRLRCLGERILRDFESIEECPVRNTRVVGFVIRVGVSTYPGDGDDAETLLENAEAAAERLGPAGGVGFYSHAAMDPWNA